MNEFWNLLRCHSLPTKPMMPPVCDTMLDTRSTPGNTQHNKADELVRLCWKILRQLARNNLGVCHMDLVSAFREIACDLPNVTFHPADWAVASHDANYFILPLLRETYVRVPE